MNFARQSIGKSLQMECSNCLTFPQRYAYSMSSRSISKKIFFLGTFTLGMGVGINYLHLYQNQAYCTSEKKNDLPTFSLKEISKHNQKSDLWVTYNGIVYDVTKFLEEHPGGPERLMLAAGKSIAPFWALYQVHKVETVYKILEKYKIGLVSPEELKRSETIDINDPYLKDPMRHPALDVLRNKPFNAQVPSSLIMDNYLTPNALWFCRHHHPVPDIDPDTFVLEIKTNEEQKSIKLDLREIKKLFPKHTVTTTIQCAGNRRKEFIPHGKVQGLSWGTRAISTASWSGVRLRDILIHCGLKEYPTNIEHIQFEAVDAPYDASIPVEKAMSKYGDVLLAYEMNGVELPREHGAPLRVIVPGHLGARNVKWVQRIIASKNESKSTWQKGVPYRGFSSNLKSFSGVDPKSSWACQELPVQSAICSPEINTKLDIEEVNEETELTVKGYAWSGGGRGIVRVEVSADGGKTWHTANFTEGPSKDQMKQGRAWAWTLWELELPLSKELIKQHIFNNQGNDTGQAAIELRCRAIDTSYNSQPDNIAPLWNLRGILNNSQHRLFLPVG